MPSLVSLLLNCLIEGSSFLLFVLIFISEESLLLFILVSLVWGDRLLLLIQVLQAPFSKQSSYL